MFDAESPLYQHVDDVSILMRERAEKTVFCDAMTVSSLQPYIDPPTMEAWKWIEKCRQLMQDLSFKNQFPGNTTVPGVRTALGLDRVQPASSLNSVISYSNWNSAHGFDPATRNDIMMDQDGSELQGKHLIKLILAHAVGNDLKKVQYHLGKISVPLSLHAC